MDEIVKRVTDYANCSEESARAFLTLMESNWLCRGAMLQYVGDRLTELGY